MVNKTAPSKAVICVIGLGYVGLPLAKAFLKSHRVVGFDIDREKVADFGENNHNQNLLFTTQPEDIRQANFVTIGVPAPVTTAKEVEPSFIFEKL